MDTAHASTELGDAEVDRPQDPCLATVRADAVRWCVAALAGSKAEVGGEADGCEPDLALRSRAVRDALGLVLAETPAASAELCARAVGGIAAR